MFRAAYGAFSYLGAMTVAAALITGFDHDPRAPLSNVAIDVALYIAFIAIHIVMTMPAFKRAVFGTPQGTASERRIYVTISIVTWLGVFALHQPVPGFAFTSPGWLQFAGLCGVLLSVVAFYEFATLEGMGRLLGVVGSDLSHSVGSETPLMKEGSYASVRHPMYRAAFFMCFASLLIHPHAGQALFAAMVAGSFIGFVPFEEHQLLRARGEEYRSYMIRTPYRVFRGVW